MKCYVYWSCNRAVKETKSWFGVFMQITLHSEPQLVKFMVKMQAYWCKTKPFVKLKELERKIPYKYVAKQISLYWKDCFMFLLDQWASPSGVVVVRCDQGGKGQVSWAQVSAVTLYSPNLAQELTQFIYILLHTRRAKQYIISPNTIPCGGLQF